MEQCGDIVAARRHWDHFGATLRSLGTILKPEMILAAPEMISKRTKVVPN